MNMSEIINNQFDEFQKELETKEKNLKYRTFIHVNDDFYKMIDDIAETNLSDERSRRIKDTNLE